VDDSEYVAERYKESLWNDLMAHFNLPECEDEVATRKLRATVDCYRWRGDDGVNDRPVGKPQEEGMINIAASFSLSKKPRFVDPVGKSQYS
jgi:hypothetical protein